MIEPVRWSNLRYMGQSPAHYQHHLQTPFEPTAAMRFGALVHHILLGGDRRFVVWPGTRRGKDWEAFRDENGGAEIVTGAEWDTAGWIAGSVRLHEEAMAILESGEQERRIFWSAAGWDCAGTPDVLGRHLVDLKISNTSSPDRFPWHARRMLWHAQLAWYLSGARELGMTEPGRVSIVAVECKPPHVVTVFDLTPNALDEGERIWRLYFERLLVCEKTGVWPGYVNVAAPFDVPEDDSGLVLDVNGEELMV